MPISSFFSLFPSLNLPAGKYNIDIQNGSHSNRHKRRFANSLERKNAKQVRPLSWHLRGLGKQISALALGLLVASQPILAHATDIQIANGSGATLDTSANGTTIININGANSSGLSHNQFDSYNVGAGGVILNNSNQEIVSTGLGGLIQGNANLQNSGPATVIFNEVTGTSRSLLEGATEVAGTSADVIVANPNGITCNGCSFFNTPQATLTTGSPVITGGKLTSLEVEGGDVRIGINGADLGSVDIFNIVSRQIGIEGAIKGKDAINLIAGRNSYAYQTGLITPLASDGNEPAIAIDSSLLGGMYAGRIKIVSTEAGSGVNMQGQMAANAGEMVLTSSGKLVVRKAYAKGKITAQSTTNKIQIQETLFSDDAIELQGHSGVDIDASAIVGAAGDISITGDAITLGADGLIAAGMTSDGTQTEQGILTVAGQSLTAGEGLISAGASVSIDVDTLDISRVSDDGGNNIRSLGNISITADQVTATNARVAAGNDVTLESNDSLFVTGGRFEAANNLSIAAQTVNTSATLLAGNTLTTNTSVGAFTNSGTLFANSLISLNATGNFINSGTVQSNATLESNISATLQNLTGGTIQSTQDMVLTASAISNAGTLIATQGDLTVKTTSTLTNDGTITTDIGDILIQNDGGITNNSNIIASGDIVISGLTADESGAIVTAAASEISGENISLSAASLSNAGMILAQTGNATLNLVGNLTNTGSIEAATDLNLNIDGNVNHNSGAITAGQHIILKGYKNDYTALVTIAVDSDFIAQDNLAILAASLTNAGPLGTVSGDVLLQLTGDFTNTGLLYAGNDAVIKLDGTLTNSFADIIINNNLTITALDGVSRATALKNISGLIESYNGDITIKAETVLNENQDIVIETQNRTETWTERDWGWYQEYSKNSPSGPREYTFYYTNNITEDILVNAGIAAQLISGGNLIIDAGTVTNKYSQISANNDINISGGSLTNIGLDLQRTDSISSYRIEDRRTCNKRLFGWDCYNWTERVDEGPFVSTYTTEAVYSTIQAGGNISANVTGYITNESLRSNDQTGLSSGDTSLADVSISDGVDLGGLATTNTSLLSSLNNILGRSALFDDPVDPNAPYLVESNPDFIDPSKFLGSDYMIGRLGVDLNDVGRRFGDSFTETQLVRDQIFELTGNRFLGDATDDKEQMEALYDNAVDQSAALGLSLGTALTPDQMANLTQDIVWLETQQVNGEEVLVPRVYLAEVTADNINLNSGQIIAGGSTTINAEAVNNSGLLSGSSGLNIIAQDSISNRGGSLFSDAAITIEAGTDFANLSGLVQGGDISIDAVNISNETLSTTNFFENGFTDTVQQLAQIQASGNLTITASGSVTAIGSDFTSGGEMTISADEDVTVSALGIETNSFSDSYTNYSLENQLSSFNSGASISITADQDLSLTAQIEATENITLTATSGDLALNAVQDVNQMQLGDDQNGMNSQTLTSQTSSLEAGGNITLSSGANATFTGTDIYADGAVDISAESDIIFDTAKDFSSEETYTSSEGFLSSHESQSSVQSLTNTGVNIAAGSGLDIKSDTGDVTLYGTLLDTVDGDINLEATDGNIYAGTADDSYVEQSSSSSSALFGLISSSSQVSVQSYDALAAEATSADNLSLISGEDLDLIGTQLGAEGNININVGGDLSVVAAIDQHFESRFYSDTGLVIATTETLTDNHETAEYASLDAGGELTVDVGGSTSLTTYGTNGGPADAHNVIYPEELLEQDGLQLLTENLVEEYFHEETRTLSPAFKALVALAVSNFVMPGLGLGSVFSGTSFFANAGNAFLSAAGSNLIVSGIEGAITGQLDIGAALQGAFITGITAGLTAGIDLSTFGIEVGEGVLGESLLGFGSGNLTLGAILESGLDNVISSGINSAVYGTDFMSSLGTAMLSSVVNLAAADFQNEIGDIFANGANGGEGSLGHMLLHSGLGCVTSSITGGNCAAGAAGGLIQSVYAGAIQDGEPTRDQYESDEAFNTAYGEWSSFHLNMVSMLGGIGGYVFSGGEAANVNIASSVAQSGLQNNYLGHTEIANMRQELHECNGKESCLRETIEKYMGISEELDAAFRACTTDACRNYHASRIIAVEQTGAFDDLMRILNGGNTSTFFTSVFTSDFSNLQYDYASSIENQLPDEIDALAAQQLREEVISYSCGSDLTSCDINTRLDMDRWGLLDSAETKSLKQDIFLASASAESQMRINLAKELCGSATGAACDSIVNTHIADQAARAIRIGGALTFAGGVLEVVTGTALCTSQIGCVAGAALGVIGADNITAGGLSLLTGEDYQSFGSQLFQEAGLSRDQAEILYGLLGAGLELAAARALINNADSLTNETLSHYRNTGELPIMIGNVVDRPPVLNPTQQQLESANNLGIDPRWVNSDGSIDWPPNNGFVGTPENMTLQPGTLIDRYGSPNGGYLSPAGTPFDHRALPPSSANLQFTTYEVVRSLPVNSGEAAPWFGQTGGGTQYQLQGVNVQQMIDQGYIRVIE